MIQMRPKNNQPLQKYSQQKPAYLVDSQKPNEQIVLENMGVVDYGLIHAIGGGEDITLHNVFHTGNLGHNTSQAGCFFAMLWPAPGQECKRLVWDNSGLAGLLKRMGLDPKYEWIRQGPAEAAFRFKCHEVNISRVKFRGYLNDGTPWKQIVQVRHTSVCVFDSCEFADGWVDIGEQQTAGKGYERAQKVLDLTFKNCVFHKWMATSSVADRHPGTWRVRYINCTNPYGQKFSSDKNYNGV